MPRPTAEYLVPRMFGLGIPKAACQIKWRMHVCMQGIALQCELEVLYCSLVFDCMRLVWGTGVTHLRCSCYVSFWFFGTRTWPWTRSSAVGTGKIVAQLDSSYVDQPRLCGLQELDFIEHFSGHGVLAREACCAGYATASLDFLHPLWMS